VISSELVGSPTLSDEEVVRRVRAGEVALFEVLVRRHDARVYRTARAILRDEAEAEDAMQAAWLHAYQHLGEFAGAAAFSTWLVRIAANEALGRLRRKARLVPVEDPEGEEGSTMDPIRRDGPEDRAAAREAVRLLERHRRGARPRRGRREGPAAPGEGDAAPDARRAGRSRHARGVPVPRSALRPDRRARDGGDPRAPTLT
jgi:RNA polymerase sigma factor (sigma-70 family)